MLLKDALFVQVRIEHSDRIDKALMGGLAGRQHEFADCRIVPQRAVSQPGGIPPRIGAYVGGESKSLERLADALARRGDEIGLVGASEELHKPPRFTVKQRDA